jgi:hypothetical protein
MMNTECVKVILQKMVELLLFVDGYDNWVSALNKCHKLMAHDSEAAISNILAMYGGMGSLNDIVLCRNGRLLIKENNEFDSLRLELYRLCHETKT